MISRNVVEICTQGPLGGDYTLTQLYKLAPCGETRTVAVVEEVTRVHPSLALLGRNCYRTPAPLPPRGPLLPLLDASPLFPGSPWPRSSGGLVYPVSSCSSCKEKYTRVTYCAKKGMRALQSPPPFYASRYGAGVPSCSFSSSRRPPSPITHSWRPVLGRLGAPVGFA